MNSFRVRPVERTTAAVPVETPATFEVKEEDVIVTTTFNPTNVESIWMLQQTVDDALAQRLDSSAMDAQLDGTALEADVDAALQNKVAQADVDAAQLVTANFPQAGINTIDTTSSSWSINAAGAAKAGFTVTNGVPQFDGDVTNDNNAGVDESVADSRTSRGFYFHGYDMTNRTYNLHTYQPIALSDFHNTVTANTADMDYNHLRQYFRNTATYRRRFHIRLFMHHGKSDMNKFVLTCVNSREFYVEQPGGFNFSTITFPTPSEFENMRQQRHTFEAINANNERKSVCFIEQLEPGEFFSIFVYATAPAGSTFLIGYNPVRYDIHTTLTVTEL